MSLPQNVVGFVEWTCCKRCRNHYTDKDDDTLGCLDDKDDEDKFIVDGEYVVCTSYSREAR